MTPDGDRERLATTFDRAAGIYQRARPDYPSELFDDLITVAGLVKGDHLLEIGCGLFKVVHIRHFDWERTYDADS